MSIRKWARPARQGGVREYPGLRPHTIVGKYAKGHVPTEHAWTPLKRVSRNYDHDQKRMASFNINFLCRCGKTGCMGLGSCSRPKGKPSKFAVNDSGGESRLENCVTLYEPSFLNRS